MHRQQKKHRRSLAHRLCFLLYQGLPLSICYCRLPHCLPKAPFSAMASWSAHEVPRPPQSLPWRRAAVSLGSAPSSSLLMAERLPVVELAVVADGKGDPLGADALRSKRVRLHILLLTFSIGCMHEKPPRRAVLFILVQLQIMSFLIMYSAICRALSAAPLRIWSPQTQRFRPCSMDSSLRMRPTSTSFLPDVKSGIG